MTAVRPGGAHVLVGNDLGAAALLVEAAAAAGTVSRHAVHLSKIATGAGGLVALTGRGARLSSRALRMVHGAAALSLGEGIWTAREIGRRPLLPPVPGTPWHVLPAQAVLDQLGTTVNGLSGEEAYRRHQVGEDTVRQVAPNLVRAFAREFANPLTPILLGGAALSAAVGSVLDAGLVVSVAVLSALVGAVQQQRADRDLARLIALSAVRAHVRRDGQEIEIPADELVSGDIVVLGSNEVVPADCRLLEAIALEVDESSLTGESLPATKTPEPVAAGYVAERASMLFEGTTVAAGRATAVVVATGSATEAGRSMAAAAGPHQLAGVEARLTELTELTIPISLGAAGLLLGAGLLRGLPARDTLSAGVALAVAAVPEGLPFLATVAELAAARRLSARGALVRNPRTIETLGRVDVLCFDKTGTLTEGKIRLRSVSDGTTTVPLDDADEWHRQVVAAGLRATPERREGRKLPHLTDRAVTKGARAANVQREEGLAAWTRESVLPFEPRRGYHATLGRLARTELPDTQLLSVKGAPEVLLPRCTRRRTPSGQVHLIPDHRQALTEELHRLGQRGYRILAVAERAFGEGWHELTDRDVTELTFLGFLALSDPVRVSAGPSVVQLRDAGVQVLMITGDHPSTAESIAAELDVLNGGRVVTGAALDALDDDALDALLPEVAVVARGTPAHKVRVVEAFRRLGKVVAMTGDGANDAPAIRLADVGIALGKRGTPAARAAADVVVTDDRLETILDVLVEGRAMWASVRTALGILVGGNLGEIVFTLVVSSLASAAVLAAVVQTPGVSQFFGCTPLGPVGWGIAAASSVATTVGSVGLSPVVERLTSPNTAVGSAIPAVLDAVRRAPPVNFPTRNREPAPTPPG